MIIRRPDGNSTETEIESVRVKDRPSGVSCASDVQAPVRKERVSLLRKAIFEGQYRVDSKVVAMKMFQEAEEL